MAYWPLITFGHNRKNKGKHNSVFSKDSVPSHIEQHIKVSLLLLDGINVNALIKTRLFCDILVSGVWFQHFLCHLYAKKRTRKRSSASQCYRFFSVPLFSCKKKTGQGANQLLLYMNIFMKYQLLMPRNRFFSVLKMGRAISKTSCRNHISEVFPRLQKSLPKTPF